MNIEKVIRDEKLEIYANLVAGLVILAAGIFFTVSETAVKINEKAIIGLSFIPLAAAFGTAYQLRAIQKHPKETRSMVIAMSDERLAARRNEAEAIAHRLMGWLLRLTFFGYTLMFPADIFETVGWWFITFLFCLSYLLPVVVLGFIGKKAEEDPIEE